MGNKVNIVFLGAPGSGKGTQAKKLVMNKRYQQISTGDLLRHEIALESDLGKEIKELVDGGKFVDDDIVVQLLKKNCNLSENVYIFDGYPRTLNQAKILDEQILGGSIYKVICFKVDIGSLISRITNRRLCKSCGAIYNLKSSRPVKENICDACQGELYQRADDVEETLRARYDLYIKEFAGIEDFYKKKGNIHYVDAESGEDQVYAEIEKIIH